MNFKQKIAKVLKHIKEESEINFDSNWIEFKFNLNSWGESLIGAGILSADEERRILLKLQKERII